MKFSGALTTLFASATLVNALPNNFQYKRQFNGTASNTTSSVNGGGAGVDAINTGLSTATVTQTLTTTISQQYTTFVSTSVSTATIVVPLNGGAGVAPVNQSPGSGSVVNQQGGAPAAQVGSGSSPANGPVLGSSAAQCSCAPAVVATGIYTVTVVNQVDLGTSTYYTTYPTTTLGLITIAGGSIVGAVPTVTNSAVVASNTNAVLAPNQSYGSVTVGGQTITIIITNTIITDVVLPVNGGGNNAGAGVAGLGLSTTAPFSNSSSTTSISGTASLTSLPTASTTGATSASISVTAGAPIAGNSAQTATTQSSSIAAPTTLAPGTAQVAVGSLGTTPLYNQPAWINDILSITNAYRARNQAPPVVWDQTLANFALTNANTNAASGNLVHTANMPGMTDPYGENLGEQYGQNNPDYLVYLWYNEMTKYSFSTPGFSDATGHFTQLVWLSSTSMGCAYVQASDAQGTYYLTCEYSPPGNFDNQYQTNVLPDNSGTAIPVPSTSI